MTTTPPAEVHAIPDSLDDIPGMWLIGFDGRMWDDASQDFEEVDWFPSELRIGDEVGIFTALT